MEYLSQSINSTKLNAIFEVPLTLRNRMVQVIVIPTENNALEQSKHNKRQLGFAKGAEIPDAFFEPLSEEDLQLWGL